MTYYRNIAILFILFVVLTLSIWTYWAGHSHVIFNYWLQGRGNDSAAAWGDSFGGFNALFGSLGFAAVLATLISQIKSSTEQQKDQHRQRFDATFFEIMKMIRELRSELRFQFSRDYINLQKPPEPALRKVKEGRDAVTAAAAEMRFWIARMRKVKNGNKKQICEKYMTYVHGRYESRFGPYFRMLYTIMSKISRDGILSNEEKVYYGNILRSQLNQFEVSLIAINATSPKAGDLDKLINEFRLLKYLPSGVIKTQLSKIYPEEAFSARAD